MIRVSLMIMILKEKQNCPSFCKIDREEQYEENLLIFCLKYM